MRLISKPMGFCAQGLTLPFSVSFDNDRWPNLTKAYWAVLFKAGKAELLLDIASGCKAPQPPRQRKFTVCLQPSTIHFRVVLSRK